MYRKNLGLVALALLPTLAACSAGQSEPVPYPAEDGAYYQIYQQDGAAVLQVARVSGGRTFKAEGILPTGAGIGSMTTPVQVVFGECGRFNVISVVHAGANPTGQQAQRLHLIEAVAGSARKCDLHPMPSSVVRVGA